MSIYNIFILILNLYSAFFKEIMHSVKKKNESGS